jgi:hypothetical protein
MSFSSKFAFLGSKRKSQQVPGQGVPTSSSPQLLQSQIPPQHPAGTISPHTPPPNLQNSPQLPQSNPSASQTSLPQPPQQPGASPTPPMNPNNLGRPPSYTQAYAPQQMGAPPPMGGRPHSPMPPPPINTSQQQPNYPPPQQLHGQAPAPPGYPPQGAYAPYPTAPPPAAASVPYRPAAAIEADAGNKAKAQLIVGIDFVSFYIKVFSHPSALLTRTREQLSLVSLLLSQRTMKQRKI